MKVILTQDVRGQGKKGQLIDAAEGYARNFLLPRKLAVLATADAINTMNLKEKAAALLEEFGLKIVGCHVNRCGRSFCLLYWTITQSWETHRLAATSNFIPMEIWTI